MNDDIDDVQAALERLERLGVVRRTGEFKDGKPVYSAHDAAGKLLVPEALASVILEGNRGREGGQS